MNRPSVWLLESGDYQLRIEFRFVNQAGVLLKTKSWELTHQRTEPAKVILLQLNATLLAATPRIQQLNPNYFLITTLVDGVHGDFTICTFKDLPSEQLIQQLTAFAMTFSLRLEPDAIHLNLHTTQPNPS